MYISSLLMKTRVCAIDSRNQVVGSIADDLKLDKMNSQSCDLELFFAYGAPFFEDVCRLTSQ